LKALLLAIRRMLDFISRKCKAIGGTAAAHRERTSESFFKKTLIRSFYVEDLQRIIMTSIKDTVNQTFYERFSTFTTQNLVLRSKLLRRVLARNVLEFTGNLLQISMNFIVKRCCSMRDHKRTKDEHKVG
jgi:hypothetical protein